MALVLVRLRSKTSSPLISNESKSEAQKNCLHDLKSEGEGRKIGAARTQKEQSHYVKEKPKHENITENTSGNKAQFLKLKTKLGVPLSNYQSLKTKK